MYVFELLHGRHCVGSKLVPATGKKTKSRTYVASEKGNNIIHTEVNLLEHFGPSASSKFRLISGPDDRKPQPPPEPEPVDDFDLDDFEEDELGNETDVPVAEEDDGFDKMKVSELKAFALEQDIDLGHAKKKADIVEAIRDELTLRAE